MDNNKMKPKIYDVNKIHIPEDYIIVEIDEKEFLKSFFKKGYYILRTKTAYYWFNDEIKLWFCAERNGAEKIKLC